MSSWGSIAYGTTVDVLWPGTGACISPVAIFHGLLFKIAVRSERLCTLVAVLLDAFVTAFNLRRTHRVQRTHVWQN